MEKGSITSSLGPILRAEMISRNSYLTFILNTANKDKQTRARPIQARVRSGGVKFDKTAEWYAELEDELARFPKARHDDQVDALAWLGLALDNVQSSLTLEEEEEAEYLEEIRGLEEGRSAVCGY